MTERTYRVAKTSIGRQTAATQTASGPPVQDLVSVAVLPGSAVRELLEPPDPNAPAKNIWSEGFMESRDWQSIADRGGIIDANSEEAKQHEVKYSKLKRMFSFGRKEFVSGLSDKPPYIMRQVPYTVWRKHYAKDKDGNYHGTDVPAEDCLLLPVDAEKWLTKDGKPSRCAWEHDSIPADHSITADEIMLDCKSDHIRDDASTIR